MRLIAQADKRYVWLDAVEKLESAVLSDERVRPAHTVNGPEARAVQLLSRALGKERLSRSMPARPGIGGGVLGLQSERIKGEVVFPSRERFIDGLVRSKVSVCFHSGLRTNIVQTLSRQ